MSKVSINKKRIVDFCKKHHIISLELFGSILTPHFSSKSDVDILVKFEKKHIPSLFDIVDMEEELTSIVGRKVDLKTPEDLSSYFRDEVLAQAKILYVK
jgi:predicted nucleotidyltransferase